MLGGCNSNKQQGIPSKLPTEIPAVFREQFKHLNLLHYRKGNFTGSGKEEYIVFYDDPSQRYESAQRNIDKIMIFTKIDTGWPKLYEINDSTMGPYDAEALRIINNKKLQFGTWDGYCRITDYNENGLAGLGFFVNIYEYHNEKMESVLESPPTYSHVISDVETINKNNMKYIKVYGSGGGEKPGEIVPEGYRDWYLYSWNKEKGKYEIIDRGVEEWHWKSIKGRP